MSIHGASIAGKFLPFVVLTTLGISALQPATAGHFITTGTTNIERSQGTATLLADGRVLTAGGLGNGGASGAGIYNPATGIGTTISPMSSDRYLHTGTLLPSGKVFVVGFSGTCELYDPVSGNWTNSSPPPYFTQKHTATLLTNGIVLVVGGEMTPAVAYSNAFLYNPATETWKQTGSMSTKRRRHTATLLADGTVLVASGGGDGSGQDLPDTAETYDPVSETWSSAGTLNVARRFHTATLLPNGKVLVAGGQGTNTFISALRSAELYDPTTRQWTLTGQMTTGRLWHAASLLPNGKVLVSGGSVTQLLGVHSSAEIYDPETQTWTNALPMAATRSQHNSTLLPNGQVLVGSELYIEAGPITLEKPVVLTNGAFAFGFTNTPLAAFTALATTNLAQALSNWSNLGGVTEAPPGQFHFTDLDATNFSQRFYRIRSN